jgi:hypothetical protein
MEHHSPISFSDQSAPTDGRHVLLEPNMAYAGHFISHPTHPGPPLPFSSMQTAVTRTEQFQPDTVYGPEYCVSIHEALKGKIS